MKKINLFQSLIFSLLIGFCYTATAGQENPEQKTGTRIVQHVHLNGIGGHNEFQRTNMREQYEACARDNDYAGLLVLPLPNGDVPKIISNRVTLFMDNLFTLEQLFGRFPIADGLDESPIFFYC